MCIAIYKAAGKIISKETLEQCFKSNPDGTGYMYNKDNKLHIKKGFFGFEDFYSEYEKDQNEQCVIHFRIKTHGEINTENCHPFQVTTNLGFIHNGIIGGYGTKEHSDTYKFNEEILKPLVTTFGKQAIWKVFVKSLIEGVIGWSKLVFLDNQGRFTIYNAHKGEWDDGVWYSNSSYKPPKITHYPPLDNPYEGRWKKTYPTVLKSIEEGKTYFLSRKNEESIHEGDWVEVKYPHRGMTKGEWVEVIQITKDATCVIETGTGTQLQDFPGCYLAHPKYIQGEENV